MIRVSLDLIFVAVAVVAIGLRILGLIPLWIAVALILGAIFARIIDDSD